MFSDIMPRSFKAVWTAFIALRELVALTIIVIAESVSSISALKVFICDLLGVCQA
jgi:hypothetical protein